MMETLLQCLVGTFSCRGQRLRTEGCALDGEEFQIMQPMMARTAFRYDVRKSGWRVPSLENFPPEDTATRTGRSRRGATFPWFPTLNVQRTRTTWSILHAFSTEAR